MQKQDVQAIEIGIKKDIQLLDECLHYLKENPDCENPEEVLDFIEKVRITIIELKEKL
jgi:hypothetical protein